MTRGDAAIGLLFGRGALPGGSGKMGDVMNGNGAKPNFARRARKKLGWTQRTMADRLGVSARSIIRFEKGDRPMKPWARLAIRQLLREPAR